MKESQHEAPFLDEVRAGLARNGESKYVAALDAILAGLSCTVGTIHSLEPGTRLLVLKAQRGIPSTILEKVEQVPVGKGMAGLAAERREAVQVCNLQTDNSGVARPDARQTEMRGSIAVPVFRDGEVCGVLGVGRSDEHDFSGAESALLAKLADLLSPHLGV